MKILFFPLFGNTWEARDDSPSTNEAESKLIRQAIHQVSPQISALESYALARKFISMKSQSVSIKSVRQIVVLMEKFLIWCFYVMHVSPLLLNNSDLVSFFKFLKRTPRCFVRSKVVCKRFIEIDGSIKFNPEWRPFFSHSLHGADSQKARSMLAMFYKYISAQAERPWNIPRFRTGSRLKVNHYREGDENLADRYFEHFLDTGGNYVKNRSSRASFEKQVFLLATCYLLKIPFSKLVEEVSLFNMACFTRDEQGVWSFCIMGRAETIVRTLPERYVGILMNYRSYIGLSGFPQPKEIQPIYQSHYAAMHILSSLPMFDFMRTTIGQLLQRLSERAPCSSGESSCSINFENSCYSAPPKKSVCLRRSKRLARVVPRILTGSPLSPSPFRCNISPPPLCLIDVKSTRKIPSVSASETRSRLSVYLGTLSFSDVETLDLFAFYANSAPGRRSVLKIKAFEKLILWCVFIRNTPISQLTEVNVSEFFTFCVNPPSNWCSKSNYPRSFEFKAPDGKWAPFKLFTDLNEAAPRAVSIVERCSCVMQDLIDLCQLSSNPFNKLSSEFLSLRYH